MSITRILSYTKLLDTLEFYIYSDSGLVVESRGIPREEAEDLAAWIPGLVSGLTSRLSFARPIVVALKDKRREIAAILDEDEAIICGPSPGLVHAMLRAFSGDGPTCMVCGGDLSLAIVRCPHCGARAPFSVERCPTCGRRLDYRRCPYCGSVITPSGTRAGVSRLFHRVAESCTVE